MIITLDRCISSEESIKAILDDAFQKGLSSYLKERQEGSTDLHRTTIRLSLPIHSFCVEVSETLDIGIGAVISMLLEGQIKASLDNSSLIDFSDPQ